MRKADVIVIGNGVAGLYAACLAAESGKKVDLLTYGGGTSVIAGGVIDILGYGEDGKIFDNPMEGITTLEASHPYRKVGTDLVAKAMDKFVEITKNQGYEYIGSISKNMWIPTAIGSFKPTALVPKSSDGRKVLQAKHILVVGFDTMKDFYADIVKKNLARRLAPNQQVDQFVVKLNFEYGRDLRDITALDVARWLETEAGRAAFVSQVKPHIKEHTAIVLPPVLGIEANYDLLNNLETQLGASLVEVSSLPPAVTGLRLSKMLTKYAKQLGVQIIQKANVIDSRIENGKCISVTTEGFDRTREYFADKFIIATGGVYGGGIKTALGEMHEQVLHIDIEVPANQLDWSNPKLFSKEKQAFALMGVNVDEQLRPLDKSGKVVADNVRIIGRTLAGYDFCVEKSGNGVALATAYKAVCGEA